MLVVLFLFFGWKQEKKSLHKACFYYIFLIKPAQISQKVNLFSFLLFLFVFFLSVRNMKESQSNIVCNSITDHHMKFATEASFLNEIQAAFYLLYMLALTGD